MKTAHEIRGIMKNNADANHEELEELLTAFEKHIEAAANKGERKIVYLIPNDKLERLNVKSRLMMLGYAVDVAPYRGDYLQMTIIW